MVTHPLGLFAHDEAHILHVVEVQVDHGIITGFGLLCRLLVAPDVGHSGQCKVTIDLFLLDDLFDGKQIGNLKPRDFRSLGYTRPADVRWDTPI